jgi:DNA-binding response OmpR family regulator
VGALLSTNEILIVEESFLLGEAIADLIRDWSMEPVGPLGRLEEACCVARERALDGAILGVKLGGDLSFPVASILIERGIPFVFVTAYAEERIPLEFRGAPLLHKPFDPRKLKETVASLPMPRWRRAAA